MTTLINEASNGLANGTTMKKPKMSKNQMRRAKKKESKVKERESREGSVVTELEHEKPEEPEVRTSSEPNLNDIELIYMVTEHITSRDNTHGIRWGDSFGTGNR